MLIRMPSFFAAAMHALASAGRVILIATAFAMDASAQDRYAAERQAMLDEIVHTTHATATETGRAALSDRVIAAMGKVPRHRLVPPGQERQAYLDRPLPIGRGQTISQPFIVALMTELLDVRPGDKVLEIGT